MNVEAENAKTAGRAKGGSDGCGATTKPDLTSFAAKPAPSWIARFTNSMCSAHLFVDEANVVQRHVAAIDPRHLRRGPQPSSSRRAGDEDSLATKRQTQCASLVKQIEHWPQAASVCETMQSFEHILRLGASAVWRQSHSAASLQVARL
eukprot:1238717-Pleurochrysis_carterae.AAC.3